MVQNATLKPRGVGIRKARFEYIKTKGILCLGFVFFMMLRSHAQDNTEFTVKMEKEAKVLRTDCSEYAAYLAKEEALFKKQAFDREVGMHVIYEPDLQTIAAPLAYFFVRLKEAPDRWPYYLKAIATSKNVRDRQQFVHYLWEKQEKAPDSAANRSQVNWSRYLSISGNKEWANTYIAENPLEHVLGYEHALPYQVIYHWADSLGTANKTKAYAYVRTLYTGGPSNGDGERFFKLFYRLKPERTQQELLEYWHRDNGAFRFYVLKLLSESDNVNKKVASQLVTLRANKDENQDFLEYMNTAIAFLDPEQGKKEITSYLAKEMEDGEAMENHYVDPIRVLLAYAADLDANSKEMKVLLNYVRSDANSTFGSVYRFEMAKMLASDFQEKFKELYDSLEEKERTNGKTGSLLRSLRAEGITTRN